MARPQNFVRQPAIDHQRDRAEQHRTLLAALVVCAGVGVAAFALLQAHGTRTVYVPVPMGNSAAPSAPSAPFTPFTQNARHGPVAVDGVIGGGNPYVPPSTMPPSRIVVAAPAMPMTPFPVAVVAMPTPVDYAARDRQIADLKRQMEDIDDTIRRVRADPHYYGWIKGSTDTARQQSSDAYLESLDRRRNDLRRQKWALEGR